MDQYNITVAIKKLNLSSYINRIYLMKGCTIPDTPQTIAYNKDQTRGVLNCVVFLSNRYTFQDSVDRVKRRLFINEKARKRKSKNPQRTKQIVTEVSHFKPVRQMIGIKKCRRDVVKEALQQVLRPDYRVYLLNQEQQEGNVDYTNQVQYIFNNVLHYHHYAAVGFNGEYSTISPGIPLLWYPCNNPACAVYQSNIQNYDSGHFAMQYYPYNNIVFAEEQIRTDLYSPPSHISDDQDDEIEVEEEQSGSLYYSANGSSDDCNEQVDVEYSPPYDLTVEQQRKGREFDTSDEHSQQMETQYMELKQVNHKVAEACIRSILYIQKLGDVIYQHQTYKLRD